MSSDKKDFLVQLPALPTVDGVSITECTYRLSAAGEATITYSFSSENLGTIKQALALLQNVVKHAWKEATGQLEIVVSCMSDGPARKVARRIAVFLFTPVNVESRVTSARSTPQRRSAQGKPPHYRRQRHQPHKAIRRS